MHKSIFNEATIRLTISPVGPILIKAGGENADPSKPDMSFVRTIREGRETVYLPGSSLKGVLRSYCERLARTVDSKARQDSHHGQLLSCDPLDDNRSCGKRLDRDEKQEKKKGGKDWSGARKHKESCFICRMFGNTSFASHFRITDAYPAGECRLEERNGVAIDRVFGSVAAGPFNYETVTEGSFQTTISLRNFTLAQLGLLCLALRDLSLERVQLGFAKSRGLGLVGAQIDALVLRYSLCDLEEDQLRLLNGIKLAADNLYGVGAFASDNADEDYGYPSPDADRVPLPEGYRYVSDGFMGTEVSAPAVDGTGVDWQSLGRACVPKWKQEVEDGEQR
jgi:CRISPR-associated RAMP protein (TIGR02581 family)